MATRLALLWHMHQPAYTHPQTGEALLPWVRLHATHAYNDMAAMLERHPRVRVTVNLVPCLVEQLEQLALGRTSDRYLELSRRRVETLAPDERAFIVDQFFMVNHERSVRTAPRYAELLDRRRTSSAFDDEALRDLQVLFNLAWMGFAARAENEVVRQLVAKGAGFSEDDKTALFAAQHDIVSRVLGRWKALSERGQIELSTTPYFHPILPLLCDSDSARRAMPDAPLPPRIQFPEDAFEQVTLAVESHTRTFGKRPEGMWPAEGSVSPEALELFARAKVRWLSTDEGVLFRSHPAPAHPGLLYQAWRCDTAHGPVALAFRDRTMSDRIGFSYAVMRATDAVADFRSLVSEAGRRAAEAGLPGALVSVVLDGENAWEHYEGHGEFFLDALYRMLADEVETVTFSEATAFPTGRLDSIHSGSWVDSNFRIWIGQAEDNLAWSLLGQVRELVAKHERSQDVPTAVLDEARRHLLAAEGSDWFWWYGDDFQTHTAAAFDGLFRQRLLTALSLVGEPAPARLLSPLSARCLSGDTGATHRPPTGLIRPNIDGLRASSGQWQAAGTFRPELGSMYRSTTLLQAVHPGFDEAWLYLRFELADEVERATLRLGIGERVIELRVDARGELSLPLEGARGVFTELVDVALPRAALGLTPGTSVSLSFELQRDDEPAERLPFEGAFELRAP